MNDLNNYLSKKLWKQQFIMKRYDKPRCTLKSRDITLPTKVHVVKAMVFPVVMYGCENWTIWKLSTEELVVWHQLLIECEFEQAFTRWWWTNKPGMLQFMGSQRVGPNWVWLNWTEWKDAQHHVFREIQITTTVVWYHFLPRRKAEIKR